MSAVHSRTWYDDTSVSPGWQSSPVIHNENFDFCIIGGGLAGLSCAYHLAEKGASVALLEKSDIGAGASGRNGGFCSTGWAANNLQICRVIGENYSTEFEALGLEGLNWMRQRAFSHRYSKAEAVEGVISLGLSKNTPEDLKVLTKDKLEEFVIGPRYRWGIVDKSAFHFHPLNFLRIFAEETEKIGVKIIENIGLVKTNKTGVISSGGINLRCKRIVWATGGYGLDSNSILKKLVLPIQTFICVTSPMGAILDKYIPTNMALGDDRRAGNYFRRLPDGRLLWGMGVSAMQQKPIHKIRSMGLQNIKAHLPEMVHHMEKDRITIDYAWSGLMAYASHLLPVVGQINDREFSLCGFGGHGMNTAPIVGKKMASFLTGDSNSLDLFSIIPKQKTYGLLGRLGAEIEYRRLSFLDYLSERY